MCLALACFCTVERRSTGIAKEILKKKIDVLTAMISYKPIVIKTEQYIIEIDKNMYGTVSKKCTYVFSINYQLRSHSK